MRSYLRNDQCGATLVEYSLLTTSLALIIGMSVMFVGEEARLTFAIGGKAVSGNPTLDISALGGIGNQQNPRGGPRRP